MYLRYLIRMDRLQRRIRFSSTFAICYRSFSTTHPLPQIHFHPLISP